MDKSTIKLIGGISKESLIPLNQLGDSLLHFQNIGFRTAAFTHYGLKKVRLKKDDKENYIIYARKFNYGSLEIDLITDAVVALLPLFAGQAVPLFDLIKLAFKYSIAYGTELSKGPRPTINITVNGNVTINNNYNFPPYAPGVSDAAYPATKALAKRIDGKKIREFQMIYGKDEPVQIGEKEKKAILAQEKVVEEDIELIGKLRKIDLDRHPHGRIEREDGIQIPCDLVYPSIDWYGDHINKLMKFHCKPVYQVGLDGQKNLEKYLVLGALRIEQ